MLKNCHHIDLCKTPETICVFLFQSKLQVWKHYVKIVHQKPHCSHKYHQQISSVKPETICVVQTAFTEALCQDCSSEAATLITEVSATDQ